MAGVERFLPPGLPASRLAATLGLISDTHLPDRLAVLPASLSTIFEGCDLLLHAGDVGELRVLDALGQFAPVVAVHGNDDSTEAQAGLPQQQLLSVAGQRILLWHSHNPRRKAEKKLREADAWPPLLARIRKRAQQAGATIAVFGHTHVPMQQEGDGVLLVNPGALASGNHYLRQTRRSVALLFIRDDGAAAVRHVDLSAPEHVYTPQVDWRASFTAAHDAVSETILSPDVTPIEKALRNGDFTRPGAVKASYRRLAHRCWAGELNVITAAALLAELSANPEVVEADRQTIRQLIGAL